jgi:hypothetical protein
MKHATRSQRTTNELRMACWLDFMDRIVLQDWEKEMIYGCANRTSGE